MGNNFKDNRDMPSPVVVSIELQNAKEMDATSRDTGIDDSDPISSREGSNDDLKVLEKKTPDSRGSKELPSIPQLEAVANCWSYTLQICCRYFKWFLLLVYHLYLILGIYRTWNRTQSYGDGVKLLVIITAGAYIASFYYLFAKKYLFKPFFQGPVKKARKSIFSIGWIARHFSKIVWSIVIICFCIYAIYITRNDRRRLISVVGILCFIFLGFVMSEHRRAINWNQVLWGLSLQFSLALVVLRTQFGHDLFDVFGAKVTRFLDYTLEGSSFIFGHLPTGVLNGTVTLNGTYLFNGTADDTIELTLPPQIPIFAFKMLPVILFFSFFISILYYYGVMQVIVVKAGWLLQTIIGTTAPESLNAAANIFLGMTEAPLVIKPYVPLMTKSEIFAVMTGGFATIAGSVMAAYIGFGVNPSSLLAASVMAAPSALGYSKLFYPETEVSKTKAGQLQLEVSKERNALEAAGNGASQAIKICSNIAANLIAFLAFIKFIDELCMWLGAIVDCDFISFHWILSKIFVPVAFMMGVEWDDCGHVAKLIGLKALVNEFVAYVELTKLIKGQMISKRSSTIATFALCGFSNFSSIGITLGALGSMVPERKSDMASFAFKSMIAGTTVTLTSACMAGLLVETD